MLGLRLAGINKDQRAEVSPLVSDIPLLDLFFFDCKEKKNPQNFASVITDKFLFLKTNTVVLHENHKEEEIHQLLGGYLRSFYKNVLPL